MKGLCYMLVHEAYQCTDVVQRGTMTYMPPEQFRIIREAGKPSPQGKPHVSWPLNNICKESWYLM